jgi:hypothetical protein
LLHGLDKLGSLSGVGLYFDSLGIRSLARAGRSLRGRCSSPAPDADALALRGRQPLAWLHAIAQR